MMKTAELMHGREWRGQDLTGWLMMEKFAGVRGYWDGTDMWGLGGKRMVIAEHWRAALPVVAMDCEIFAGYGQRERAKEFVAGGDFCPGARLIVFDAALQATYVARLKFLRDVVGTWPEGCVPPATICRGNFHAIDLMEEIQQRGGEGLVVRDPANLYQPGITGDILTLTRPRSAMWFLKKR